MYRVCLPKTDCNKAVSRLPRCRLFALPRLIDIDSWSQHLQRGGSMFRTDGVSG